MSLLLPPGSELEIFSLIGHTPLMWLRFAAEGMKLNAKFEFMNLSGSIKDRLPVTILRDAPQHGMDRGPGRRGGVG
ncbi:MAG: hypothetical protein ABI222_05365 [Opitutaceae bacterium]